MCESKKTALVPESYSEVSDELNGFSIMRSFTYLEIGVPRPSQTGIGIVLRISSAKQTHPPRRLPAEFGDIENLCVI